MQDLTTQLEEHSISRRNIRPECTRKYLTLPFPAEIRELILVILLKRRTYEGWISFYAEDEVNSKSKIMSIPKVSPEDIGHTFSILCKVSKQMRADAIHVLFSKNTIALTITCDLYRMKSDQYLETNTAKLVEAAWGREALLAIRYLAFSLRNGDENMHASVGEKFKDVVEVLKHARALKRVSIEWAYRYSDRNDTRATWDHFAKIIDSDGRRLKTDRDTEGVSMWEKREGILEPLKLLRGLKDVVITGCVSDEWCRYLEWCMMSKHESLPDFRRDMFGLGSGNDAAKVFEGERRQNRARLYDTQPWHVQRCWQKT